MILLLFLILLSIKIPKNEIIKLIISLIFSYFFLLNYDSDGDLVEYFGSLGGISSFYNYKEIIFWGPLFALKLFTTESVTILITYTLINRLILQVVEKYDFKSFAWVLAFLPFSVFGYNNIMRQFIAVLFLLSINKKHLMYLTFLIHNSVLISFFDYFNKYKQWLLAVIILILSFVVPPQVNILRESNNLSIVYFILFILLIFISKRLNFSSLGIKIILFVALSNVFHFDFVERIYMMLFTIYFIKHFKTNKNTFSILSVLIFIISIFNNNYARFFF